MAPPKRKNRTLSPDSFFNKAAVRELYKDSRNPEYHCNSIWKAYRNGQTELPSSLPVRVDPTALVWETSTIQEVQHNDNGAKLVIQLQDGHLVETVIIRSSGSVNTTTSSENNNPQKTPSRTTDRFTVCVSSQVGCAMGCTFCATGTLGLRANLAAAEILEQVHFAKTFYPGIQNVVFMGMGEPLDNYEQVTAAVHAMPELFCIPYSRITVSTVGVVHAMKQLAVQHPQIQLALSLHAPSDELRLPIVPTTRVFKVDKIMEAVKYYQETTGKRVMMEYIMIDGVNDSDEAAHLLGQLLSGRDVMINLIPYNPTTAGDQHDFKSPSDERLRAFSDVLHQQYKDHKGKPIVCTIRYSSKRGQSMNAACGQLAVDVESKDIEDMTGAAKSKRKSQYQRIGDNCRQIPVRRRVLTHQDRAGTKDCGCCWLSPAVAYSAIAVVALAGIVALRTSRVR